MDPGIIWVTVSPRNNLTRVPSGQKDDQRGLCSVQNMHMRVKMKD